MQLILSAEFLKDRHGAVCKAMIMSELGDF